jgi:transposase
VKVPDETVRTVVDAVAGGMAIRAAARHYGIPGTTVHQWVHRIYRPIARAERP